MMEESLAVLQLPRDSFPTSFRLQKTVAIFVAVSSTINDGSSPQLLASKGILQFYSSSKIRELSGVLKLTKWIVSNSVN